MNKCTYTPGTCDEPGVFRRIASPYQNSPDDTLKYGPKISYIRIRLLRSSSNIFDLKKKNTIYSHSFKCPTIFGGRVSGGMEQMLNRCGGLKCNKERGGGGL